MFKREKREILALSFFILGLIIVALSILDINTVNKVEIKKNKDEKNSSDDIKKYENFDFESNLPILVIDTNGFEIDGDERVNVDITIYDSKDETNKIGEKGKVYNAGIKIRGNSTRLFPKKQYSLKMMNDKGEEKNEKMLGMKKESDWVLSAPFEDKSCMRDPLAYYVSDKIMDFAPDTKYCEVFLVDDGKVLNESHYNGLYIMIESIKRGENRVDISKDMETIEDFSFIVAKNAAKPTDYLLNNYGAETYLYDYNLILEYPKKNLTTNKINTINRHISEFERILYSDIFDIPEIGYEKYINIETFIDYYLINEFFKNTDAGYVSTYLHKSYGGKIKAGPVWDFNKSMGNSDGLSPYYDFKGFYMLERDWFDRLLEDKSFVEQVVSRYRYLRTNFLSEEYLIEFIDETTAYIKDAVMRNFERWPIFVINQSDIYRDEKTTIIDEFGDDMKATVEYLNNNEDLLISEENMSQSFDEEIEMLKVFIKNRGQWVDDNIDSLYKWVK